MAGEGDNHTFMNMLDNGFRAREVASYGGWGGRRSGGEQENIFMPAPDTSQQATALSGTNKTAKPNDYPGFFPAAQLDFAARIKWSITPRFADADHQPVVRTEGLLTVMALADETIRLSALVADPDKDKVTINWWNFRVGTYANDVIISYAAEP